MNYKPIIYDIKTGFIAQDVEVVIMIDDDIQQIEPLWYPGRDMDAIEALLKLAQKTFPSGWEIIDGEVVEYKEDA